MLVIKEKFFIWCNYTKYIIVAELLLIILIPVQWAHSTISFHPFLCTWITACCFYYAVVEVKSLIFTLHTTSLELLYSVDSYFIKYVH